MKELFQLLLIISILCDGCVFGMESTREFKNSIVIIKNGI